MTPITSVSAPNDPWLFYVCWAWIAFCVITYTVDAIHSRWMRARRQRSRRLPQPKAPVRHYRRNWDRLTNIRTDR